MTLQSQQFYKFKMSYPDSQEVLGSYLWLSVQWYASNVPNNELGCFSNIE